MTYIVITQEGMVVGSQKTLENAKDLAEDIDGVIVDENGKVIPEQERELEPYNEEVEDETN